MKLERRAAADTQNERQIDEASLHRDAQTIPSPPRKNAGAQSIRRPLSMNPVQGSLVPVPKEDYFDPGRAASGQPVRVVSLLNEGDLRNEGVSDVAALRRGDDNTKDTSKTDDSMHIVLIVGIAFIVSCAVGA